MISTAQAGVSTSGAGTFTVAMSGEFLPVYTHILFYNLSTVAGWGSIDAGASWVPIPAGIGASITVDTNVVRNLRPLIQRASGSTDITVFVAAY